MLQCVYLIVTVCEPTETYSDAWAMQHGKIWIAWAAVALQLEGYMKRSPLHCCNFAMKVPARGWLPWDEGGKVAWY